MKKKSLFIILVAALLALGTTVTAFAAGQTRQVEATYGITVMLDGKEVVYTYANGQKAEAFMVDGVTYLPVRAVADAVGKDVAWDAATQTVTLTTPGTAPATPPPSTPAPSGATLGEQNALKSAQSYLNSGSFSYEGLIDQLEYEKYSTAEATYAADNCGADWLEQAVKTAKSYLNSSAFSYTGLIDQLEYEKFTEEQAKYGADNCEADWFEQAAKCAASYLKHSSFSRQELIEQLEYEGFTNEQAVHGAEANGY